MAKKWTNEKIDNILAGRLIKRMTDVCDICAPSITKLQWKCVTCANDWLATADSVINRQSGCPYCAGNQKMTPSMLQDRLNKENRNIEVVNLFEGSYLNERKGQFKCGECEYVWSAILSNITHKRQGCPRCGKSGRYTRNSIQRIGHIPGIFYIIECSNSTEQFIKIGITKRNVKSRYTNVDFKYDIINEQEFPMTLQEAWILEQSILHATKWERYTPTIPFGGKNECFCITEKPSILTTIQEYINATIT